ncbi:MAG: SDR family oxidoreductase [Sphingomonadales bacterium]|nr:SDR family oxidoreductase [Sphingomonadales bacterium]MBU3993983.1 SDR family oxidoreductase [Alphaproteobacteria bacterium]
MTEQQKVALVTGSARGLGKAVAAGLAADGVALFLVDVLADRLEETRAELAAGGATVHAHVADIAERASCFDAVAAAVAHYGRLDILINAAGIVRFNHLIDVPEEEYRRVLAVNMDAAFFFSQAALPHIIAAHGNIVNVASQSAKIGTPYIVPYSMSKAGLVQMTLSMAMEYMEAPIRINAVCPGTMATEIGQGIPMPDGIDFAKIERYGGQRAPNEPAEVAAAVVFVASDRASAIHGAVLTADGGATAG